MNKQIRVLIDLVAPDGRRIASSGDVIELDPARIATTLVNVTETQTVLSEDKSELIESQVGPGRVLLHLHFLDLDCTFRISPESIQPLTDPSETLSGAK